MIEHFNNRFSIRLNAEENICFRYSESSFELPFGKSLSHREIFSSFITKEQKLFGFYHQERFLGPFDESSYNSDNFTFCENGVESIFDFYELIPPENKYTVAARGSMKEYLRFFFGNNKWMGSSFYIFKQSFHDKADYQKRFSQWCQFDFFMLFLAISDGRIGCGTIWYD